MNYDLYVVTDEKLSSKTHVQIAEEAFSGGADVVQLRDKYNPKDKIIEEAKTIASIARRYGKTFIVNDDLDIAIESDADGVHLGKCDGSIADARKIVSPDFIIGASVESVEDAIKAEREGASYVALSPVFDTQSKKDAHSGYGLQVLSEIKKSVKIPVLAIGGINLENVSDVIEAGADGVAVISAVVSQSDIMLAAKRMKEKITASKARR